MKYPDKIDSLLSQTPPLLISAALVFWGWQCDYLAYSLFMALFLELPVLIKYRISFDDNEINHIADLSTIIFILVAFYVFSNKSFHGIFELLSLLPFIFYLLMLAQVYSSRGLVKASALFISLRRLEKHQSGFSTEINISYPYFFICILSSSEGNQFPAAFYAGVVILFLWAFWSLRTKRKSIFTWSLIFLFAVPAGYAVQSGITHLQSIAESTIISWVDIFMWRSRDPQRTSTAIGSLGKLKLSDRIVVRVDADKLPAENRILLRESSYLNYSHGIWTNYQNTLQLVDPSPDGTSWQINEPAINTDNIAISFYMDQEASIIPLPMGLTRIYDVTAAEILHSPYGSTSLELNPGWIKYTAEYQGHSIFDSEPGDEEMEIPNIYRQELEQLAHELGLNKLSPSSAITRTRQYFLENFEYSLTQRERYPRGRYLSKFLFETKRGHCEYFATATALLLRAANIPTRYSVGYAIQEYSKLEGQYIGRASHAHSWATAYADGKWHIIDTTPPEWLAIEKQELSIITPLVDLWSWINYKLSIDDTDSDENENSLLIWLLLPILFYYLWRMKFSKQDRKDKIDTKDKIAVLQQGLDSPFYEICNELEKIHGKRASGQTLKQWIMKCKNIPFNQDVESLLKLHYSYRFNPAGLNHEEIRKMKDEAGNFLNKLKKNSA